MSDANLAKPPVGVGHMALTVADVESSHRFYTTLGLRIIGKGDDMSILELRGGTHLLLFQRGGPPSGRDECPLWSNPVIGFTPESGPEPQPAHEHTT